jgi:hypothetical protein
MAAGIQAIRRLMHTHQLCLQAAGVGRYHRAAGQVVPTIDGSPFIAVEMAAVGSKCDQIGRNKNIGWKETAPYGRGSA